MSFAAKLVVCLRLPSSSLFLEKATQRRRQHVLEEACRGDESLRREVKFLLEQEAEAKDFLEAPALEVAAQHTLVRRGSLRWVREGAWSALILQSQGCG